MESVVLVFESCFPLFLYPYHSSVSSQTFGDFMLPQTPLLHNSPESTLPPHISTVFLRITGRY